MGLSITIKGKRTPSGSFTPKDKTLWADPKNADLAFFRHDHERESHGYIAPPKLKYGVPRQKIPGFEQPNQNGIPETVMLWGRRREGQELRRYDFFDWSPAHQRLQLELIDWALDYRLKENGNVFGYYDRAGNQTTASDPYAIVRYRPYTTKAAEKDKVIHVPLSRLGVWADSFADSVALTDNHSYDDGYWDSILNRNVGKPIVQRKALGFGGNLLRRIGKEEGRIKISALNPLCEPPPLEWILEYHPEWILWCTSADVWEIRNNVKTPAMYADGRWKVSMWGKLKGVCETLGIANTGFPTILYGYNNLNPTALEGYNLVNESDVIEKKLGSYTPYVP